MKLTATDAGLSGLRDRRSAPLLATGLVAVSMFQFCLAAGAPWGAAAWGGADPGHLSSELRVASAFAAVFWLLAALTVLTRAGATRSPIPYTFGRRGTWVLTALLAIGAVMNAASQSRWERFGWAPVVFGLAVLSLRLSRSAPSDGTRSSAGTYHVDGNSVAEAQRPGRSEYRAAPAPQVKTSLPKQTTSATAGDEREST